MEDSSDETCSCDRMAGITSLGETADDIFARFEAGKSGIRYMPEWGAIC